MNKFKKIGITLLFITKKGKSNIAITKSFSIVYSNWDDFNSKISDLCKANGHLIYIGIKDIFYVSGLFKEREVLGKSYIDDFEKIMEAKSLILKENNYSCKQQSIKNWNNWYLVSLIYHYWDKINNDKLTITCLTPVKSKTIKEAKSKIKTFSKSSSFIKKILPYRLDKLKHSNLRYVGIEDFVLLKTEQIIDGSFEVLFMKYKKMDEINKLMPSAKELKETFHSIDAFH